MRNTKCITFLVEYIPESLMIIKCTTDLEDNTDIYPKMNCMFDNDNIHNEVKKAATSATYVKMSISPFKCIHMVSMIDGHYDDITISGTIEDHCRILHRYVVEVYLGHGNKSNSRPKYLSEYKSEKSTL